MRSILVIICCVVLGVGLAAAKERKEGEGKGAGHGKQGRQLQSAGGGGRRARLNRGNVEGTNQFNARRGGKAANRRISGEGEGKLPAVQSERRAGRKAEIKHFDLANANHTNIEKVTFKENNRIVGAEHWRGEHYVVFRSYRAVWHDRGWWVGHYPRVVLIGGGWYYWNAGFWYPAWGYDPGASVYAYDGPIYAYNDLPPDQVVANVQTELQNQGYYHGEVDGLLGPLTRAAIADYQRDHGLYTTAAIDEPTMNSLGFS